MSGLTLVIVCIVTGLFLRRHGKLGASGVDALNSFAIHVSLPSLALLKLHDLPGLTREVLLLASMPWVLFALSLGFFRLMRGWIRMSPSAEVALALACGLGNTSFVGLPLIEALIGPRALDAALIVDQPGTFLALSILGIPLAVRAASRTAGLDAARLAFWRFPPFIAAIAGLALRPIVFPAWLADTLARLGSTLAPVTLVAVGAQLATSGWRPARESRALAVGLAWKLALAPLIALVIFSLGAALRGTDGHVLLLQAAMAPMITGAVVAAQLGLEPRLVELCVAYGIPLSLVTVPTWNWAWQRLFG